MSDRGTKLISGFLLKSCYMFLNIAIGFFMMPFLLHALGDKMYGLWVLVGSFTAYFAYLDFGMSSAIGRFVSRAIGRNDIDEINEVVNTSFVIYVAIGVATIMVTFAIIGLAGLFVKSKDTLHIMQFLLLLLGLNISIGFPTRAIGSVIGANLHYKISEGILIIELILRNLLIVVFFILGYRILALGIIVFCVSMLSYSFYVISAFKLQKGLKMSLKYFNKNKIAELFSYSVYTFIYKIADIMIFRIDSLVITVFMGLAFVSHYAIAGVMISYLSYFIFNAINLIGPVFSQDEGKGDSEGIKNKFILTTTISIYVTVFIAAMLILYGKLFIIKWIGHDYVDAYPILLILIPSVSIMLMQTPSSSVLFNISRHKFLACAAVIEGLVNFALSVVLVKKLGLIGVALGTAVPMLLARLFVQPVYSCRVLGVGIKRYYMDVLVKNVLISLLGILPCYLILRSHTSADYLSLILSGIIQCAVYAVWISLTGFSGPDRKYIFRSLGDVFMKKRIPLMKPAILSKDV